MLSYKNMKSRVFLPNMENRLTLRSMHHSSRLLNFIYLSLIIIFLLSLPVLAGENIDLLQKQIGGIVNTPALPNYSTGIKIISLKTLETIYSQNENLPLMPASNMKIITSAAALTLLKPEFTFRTIIFIDTPVNEGVINGNLYLKGYGNPDLNTERLWMMARELTYKGITEIKGDIIGDDSFFDLQRTGKGWKNTYGAAPYSAKISALSLNQNTIKVWVGPSKKGYPGIISLDPPSKYFKIINQTVTSGYRSYLYIARRINSSGEDEISVKGNIAVNSMGENETINIANPPLYVASVFYEMLKKEGINISGSYRTGQISGKCWQLSETQSRPLNAIIAEFNKHSVNFIGETLLKYLAARYEGVPGTIEKGEAVIKNKFLIPLVKTQTTGMVIADGSGLSPLNRITPAQFIDVLKYMYNNFELSSDFVASLSIGGADGTLTKRFRNTSAYRKVRAKTGYIAGVSSLSGYAVTKDNEPMAFSIIMNNFYNYAVAHSVQDKISIILTGFSR